jgi:hypothetical protein
MRDCIECAEKRSSSCLGDTPRHEARVQLAEWTAEVEARIAALRAQKNGEGQPLTKLNAIALAGRWYAWFVKQHEVDPGPAKRWREMGDHFLWNVLRPHAPVEYEENPGADQTWEWAKDPEVREATRPQAAEMARVATFLASEGIALNHEAYARFVDAVADRPCKAHRYLRIRLRLLWLPGSGQLKRPPVESVDSSGGCYDPTEVSMR